MKRKLGAANMVLNDVNVIYEVFGGRRVMSKKRQTSIRKALKNTKKSFVKVETVHAIRGISFSVRKGETVGIVGSNGAGKSTILSAMAGVLPYASGSIYTRGKSSLLGVNATLIPSLTGERNIRLGCLALGLSQKEIDKKFDEIVEFSGIGDFVYLPMNAYSSGMSARLRFAISISKIPDILMIDEALATGDAAFRIKSAKKIEEIAEQAGTIFLVSHSNESIQNMCARCIWLEKGKMVMDGPTDIVLDSYTNYVNQGLA